MDALIRILKKIFKALLRSSQPQPRQDQPESYQLPPHPPSFQSSSPYPPPPQGPSYAHPEGQAWRPPNQNDYKPGGGGGPQQPFQGHKTHIGEFHDQSPQSIASSSSYFTSLRNQALHESSEMSRCFDEAHRVYDAGDHARAKQLSEEGHAHQRKRDEINSKAADWIFGENNKNRNDGTWDLHGLYVQEAVHYTEQIIHEARSKGLSSVRLIVGKGLHSISHVQKIKPAIEDLMRKQNLRPRVDPDNAGVLIVDLNGKGDLDWEWSRQLDLGKSRNIPIGGGANGNKEDEGCLVM